MPISRRTHQFVVTGILAPKQAPLPPRRSNRGRKSLFSRSLQDTVVQGLTGGMTRREVSAHAGVHPSTFYDWLKNRPDFARVVKEAELQGRDIRTELLHLNHPFRGRRPPINK